MSTIRINGVTVTGNSISVQNGVIKVDGHTVDINTAELTTLKIEVTGGLASLACDGDVTCQDVGGNVRAAGNVHSANVNGDVDAGGSVSCGEVAGSIDAGGSVRCGHVSGNIDAGGSVHCSK